mmetsp:Transcript_16734/g.45912  ORF Transcript_16734/g.45912 Transcript_16734/m.45912 type:complete len:123 (-) Transcript_16734:28-396(-)
MLQMKKGPMSQQGNAIALLLYWLNLHDTTPTVQELEKVQDEKQVVNNGRSGWQSLDWIGIARLRDWVFGIGFRSGMLRLRLVLLVRTHRIPLRIICMLGNETTDHRSRKFRKISNRIILLLL